MACSIHFLLCLSLAYALIMLTLFSLAQHPQPTIPPPRLFPPAPPHSPPTLTHSALLLAPTSIPVVIVGCRRATTLVNAWQADTGLTASATSSFAPRSPLQSIILVVDEGGPEASQVASLLASLRAKYG
eukprot:CAMPEP_0170755648 /NCGR_PEP_ID=MMETSP0437-20130122/13626_1 /TAXON_ID=0 /ORGANISM="Sexangularia sp." /LENGTH=128 /DNA_ID=CAMNT_0011094823 /DNA_START=216 /DNA_END=597 /DNA_ORIENTATION=+